MVAVGAVVVTEHRMSGIDGSRFRGDRLGGSVFGAPDSFLLRQSVGRSGVDESIVSVAAVDVQTASVVFCCGAFRIRHLTFSCSRETESIGGRSISRSDLSFPLTGSDCARGTDTDTGGRRAVARAGRAPTLATNRVFTVTDLVAASVSDSTIRAYGTGVRRFSQFCAARAMGFYPATSDSVAQFVASLANDRLAPTTVRVYVAAIRRLHVEKGRDDPTSAHRVRLAMDGYERLYGGSTRFRGAITPSVLLSISSFLFADSTHNNESRSLILAVCLVAFHGMLRPSEFLDGGARSTDHHLRRRDVTISPNRSSVVLFIRSSKTDQRARGARRVLPAISGPLCPVTAVSRYIATRAGYRDDSDGAFFRLTSSVLSPTRFCSLLRSCIRPPLIPTDYSLHSFRIGAATAALAAGVDQAAIRQLGRWRSDAFSTYTRLSSPVERRAAVLLASATI